MVEAGGHEVIDLVENHVIICEGSCLVVGDRRAHECIDGFVIDGSHLAVVAEERPEICQVPVGTASTGAALVQAAGRGVRSVRSGRTWIGGDQQCLLIGQFDVLNVTVKWKYKSVSVSGGSSDCGNKKKLTAFSAPFVRTSPSRPGL